MLDRDLAELYDVETRVLNQAVKRNIKRFPEAFMFQLTFQELKDWMSQTVISNKETMGIRKLPFVFTEQGVSMLSAVLKSDMAVDAILTVIEEKGVYHYGVSLQCKLGNIQYLNLDSQAS